MTIFYILLIVTVIIIGPLALIWSLNTLFSLGINYTLWTWLAMLVLSGSIGGASRAK